MPPRQVKDCKHPGFLPLRSVVPRLHHGHELHAPMRTSPSQPDDRQRLAKASRIVVKLGTSTVTDPDGSVSHERLAPLVASIARLRSAGKQVVLVSSGAVGL